MTDQISATVERTEDTPFSARIGSLPVYYSDDLVTIYHGETLNLLQSLPLKNFSVITDPPYSSGGAFRGDRNKGGNKYLGFTKTHIEKTWENDRPPILGDTRDQRGVLQWASLWLSSLWSKADDGANLFTFTDWRQLPTFTDAVQCGGWVWRGLATWDKLHGRPMKGRFRNHSEYIIWATRGGVEEQDTYLGSILKHIAPKGDARIHETQKPESLITELMTMIPKSHTIVDPFMGSGTTLIAAKKAGRKSIGIELQEEYCEAAAKRCASEMAMGEAENAELSHGGEEKQ
jgi:site-specific DNA-methyltransferase (adenine-specific)